MSAQGVTLPWKLVPPMQRRGRARFPSAPPVKPSTRSQRRESSNLVGRHCISSHASLRAPPDTPMTKGKTSAPPPCIPNRSTLHRLDTRQPHRGWIATGAPQTPSSKGLAPLLNPEGGDPLCAPTRQASSLDRDDFVVVRHTDGMASQR